MGQSTFLPALRMARLPSCIVAFLTVSIPIYTHTENLSLSFITAFPLVPISLCTFILNDLNDIERDRINHPARPLVSGLILPKTAAAAYLTLFALALATIHFAVDTERRYYYAAGFLLAINYNTVVDYVPKLKTLYVAMAATLPVILVLLTVSVDPGVNVLLCIFLFVLGRETLMDVRDINGDTATLARSLGPLAATRIAFGLQAAALASILLVARSRLQVAAVIFALLLFAVIVSAWSNRARHSYLLQIMKLQMLGVVAFLI